MSKILPKPYLDRINIRGEETVGLERRRNMTKAALDHGTPFPLPLSYSDIDEEFFKWVSETLSMSYDGTMLPTFKLFSNQRISEYRQTWNHLDQDGNIIMNFKAISRDLTPKKGSEQGDYCNIPGNRDYPMFMLPTIQENGEVVCDMYSMKQPMSVDLNYQVTLITNKYDLLNKFNELMLDQFKSIQCYISPNNHPIPMTLEEVEDTSESGIDSRKYYSQTFKIKVMAYIIKESDFTVTKLPTRSKNRFVGIGSSHKHVSVTDEKACKCQEEDRFSYKGITICITYPLCEETEKFSLDFDFVLEGIETKNIYDFVILDNEEKIRIDEGSVKMLNGDQITVNVSFDDIMNGGKIWLKGYDPNSPIDLLQNPETVSDEPITEEEIDINA